MSTTISLQQVLRAPDAVSTPFRPSEERCLLSLPAEIRLAILEYVYGIDTKDIGFKDTAGSAGGILIDPDYSTQAKLRPLYVCKQMHQDGNLLAMRRTSFVVNNLYVNISERLSTLHPKQIEAIRSITFVADDRHFRKLRFWNDSPFGIQNLNLDTLTIVLHRSSHWHYLFDFTGSLVTLLRQLRGVRRLVFVKNDARVKGSFKTWYNRLIGLMMKIDHRQRYMTEPAELEKTWWTWSFDEVAQSFCLEACESKPLVDEETYMQQIQPLMEELRVSVENEEWNPDPRVRNGA